MQVLNDVQLPDVALVNTVVSRAVRQHNAALLPSANHFKFVWMTTTCGRGTPCESYHVNFVQTVPCKAASYGKKTIPTLYFLVRPTYLFRWRALLQ